MYKTHTSAELREHFKLPSDYKVDGLIIYGGWDVKRYRKKFLSSIKGKYSVEKLKGFIGPILSVKTKGKRVWFVVEYGGAMLSEFIHLASMFGSKKNILVGTCGGLQKGIGQHRIIVPESSYSTGSSAHMYMRDRHDNLFHSSQKLSSEIRKRLKRMNLESVGGTTVTCEAMMGETWEDILEWEGKGYLGVEMEAATVFSVSQHFGVESAAIMQVADNLIEKETVRSESYIKKKAKLNMLRKIMLGVALDAVLCD